MKAQMVKSTLFIILFSLCLQCQGQVRVMSQLNELRTVNLAKEFGILNGNIEVFSPSKSSYHLDQPMISTNDDSFFAASRKIVTKSSLDINNLTQIQLQIYQVTSELEGVQTILSLVQVTKRNDSFQISEITQLNLTKSLEGADLFEIGLLQKNFGILLYTLNEKSFIGIIRLFENNQLQIQTGVQLQSKSSNLRYLYDIASQTTFFSVQKVDTMKIQLRKIDQQYQISDVLSEQEMCINAVQLSNQHSVLVKCIEEKQDYFRYVLYLIEPNLNQFTYLETKFLPSYEISNLKQIHFSNNVINLVSTINSDQYKIRITELTINNNNSKQISVVNDDISIPVRVSNLMGYHFSKGLITLVSQTNIYGISTQEKKVIFQIVNPSIESFKPYQCSYYGEAIAISYQNNEETVPKYTTRFIQTKVPLLVFRQISEIHQIYNLRLVNNTLSRQMTINATLITANSNEIIIKNANSQVQYVLNYPNEQKYTDIEDNYIGYFYKGYGNGGFLKSFFYSTLLTYASKIGEAKYLYSTYGENFIVFSSAYNSYTYSFYNLDRSRQEPTLNHLASYSNNYKIISVDEQSGFLLNINRYSNYQIIAFYERQKGEYQFQFIDTNCKGKSRLLFSGDFVKNQVAVLCDQSLKIYRFLYNSVQSYDLSYPEDKIVGNISKIEIQPSGLLYITDNQRIIAIDVNKNTFIGEVTIPTNIQGQYIGQIFFFTESFVIARNDNNSTTISQFSYNQFNGGLATYIRTFQDFGMKWTGKGFKAVRDFKENSNEEFLVVDSFNGDFKPEDSVNKLLYRVSGEIQAQNQLLTVFQDVDPKLPIIVNPKMAIKYNYNSYQIYDISYRVKMRTDIEIPPNNFKNNIANVVQGYYKINSNYTFNITLNQYRSVQPNQTVIDNQHPEVVKMKSFFSSEDRTTPLTYSFDDKSLINVHLFGWQFKLFVVNCEIDQSFTQRLSNETNQMNQKLVNSFNQLMVMPNALMQSTSEGISLEGLIISKQNVKNCLFYKERLAQFLYTQQGNTIVEQTVYSISENSGFIYLNQYTIQGIYEEYPNSQPQLSLLQRQQFSYQGTILSSQTVETILQDERLGFLALLKEIGSSSTQVCQIQTSYLKGTFSLDCNIYSSISQLLISNIIYIESAQQNIFVTQNDDIYYGLSSNLNQYSVINYRDFLLNKGVQFNKNSTLSFSQKLSESTILISCLEGNSFIMTLDFIDNQIIINDQVKTLYQATGFEQISGAYMNQQQQVFIPLRLKQSPTNYVFVMYEKYNTSQTDYLIRSSHSFNYSNEIKQSMVSFYNGQIILGLSAFKEQQDMKPITYNVYDKPQFNLRDLYKTSFMKNDTQFNYPFGFTPLYQKNVIELVTPIIKDYSSASLQTAHSE